MAILTSILIVTLKLLRRGYQRFQNLSKSLKNSKNVTQSNNYNCQKQCQR